MCIRDRFSYDKAYFGSYKHFVPNHYNLGYFLVGNLRAKYGNSLWEKLLTNTTRQNFPMRKTLKKQTGLNHVKQYKAVFDSLHTVWQNEDRLWEKSDFPAVSPSNKFYTNYRHNHWLNDSVILSYKTAFDEPPSFVKISSNGEEKRIVRPGAIFDESVRYRDEWIVWSEKIPDLRWQHNGHSLIRMVHTETKELIEIHSQFIAVAPVISLDKTKVAVVESDFEDNNYLSVYRLPDGELLNRCLLYTSSAEISLPDPKHCRLTITGLQKEFGKRNFNLHIAIAPTKNSDRLEWFVEKAAEIGIDEISLILCEHSERRTVNAVRLNKILVSAMKQSVKAYLPVPVSYTHLKVMIYRLMYFFCINAPFHKLSYNFKHICPRSIVAE